MPTLIKIYGSLKQYYRMTKIIFSKIGYLLWYSSYWELPSLRCVDIINYYELSITYLIKKNKCYYSSVQCFVTNLLRDSLFQFARECSHFNPLVLNNIPIVYHNLSYINRIPLHNYFRSYLRDT